MLAFHHLRFASLPLAVVLACMTAATPVQAGEPEAKPTRPPGLVLDETYPWRQWLTYRPIVIGPRDQKPQELQSKGGREAIVFLPTPGPGKDWMTAAYDDGQWRRIPGGFFGKYVSQNHFSVPSITTVPGGGDNFPKTLAAIQLRGRFSVPDPATVTGLTLDLEYRGGAIVYLNGVEIARKHLVAGPIEPASPTDPLPLADDYSLEQYNCVPAYRKPKEQAKKLYDERTRRLESIAIPTKLLVAGTNVLAVGIYRTSWVDGAILQKHGRNAFGSGEENGWATCGFQRLNLAASPAGSIPNVQLPRTDTHVWSADSLAAIGTDVKQGDRSEILRPMRLEAPRNGFASGQVVVSGAKPVTVTAKLDALTGPGGSIPPEAVKLRYAVQQTAQMQWKAPFCDALVEQPPTDALMVPIWVTVAVPDKAKPGQYNGTLTVTADGTATQVPVALTVSTWRAPDPKDRWAFFDCAPSEQTLVLQYGVKPWSPEHVALMERAMRFDADLSNRTLYIDVLRPGYLGNRNPQITFVKEGDGWKPDFTNFDTYCDLWTKTHHYAPTYIVLMAQRAMMFERDRPQATKFGAWERKPDGSLTPIEIPIFTAEAEPLWKAIIQGMRERVVKRGWKESGLQIGKHNDLIPAEPAGSFWKKVSPFPVRSVSHEDRPPFNVNPIFPNQTFAGGYPALIGGWMDPTATTTRFLTSARNESHDYCDLQVWRGLMYTSIQGKVSGLGFFGLDSWPVTQPEKDKKGNAVIRHVLPEIHDNLMCRPAYVSTPNHMLAPGADGPIATVRYELFREGLQDAEARIAIERILSDPALKAKVPPALADEALSVIRATMAQRVASANYAPRQGPIMIEMGPAWQDRVRSLYDLAGKIVAATGAP